MTEMAYRRPCRGGGSDNAGFYIAGIIGTMGLGLALYFGQVASFQPEDGAAFLEEKGYTEVSGGESLDLFNLCGKGEIARNYDASQDGERVSRTVCYNYFWGTHLPFFGVGQ